MRLLVAIVLSCAVAYADLPQVIIEAEDYSAVTGGEVRVLDRPEASGGKCVSYWEEPGVALTCAFEVAEAGEYCLTLGYACNWSDTRRQVAIDGEVVPGLEEVLLPGTGSWADFGALTLPGPDGGRARIPLTAGAHTLTLTNVDSRGLAWDYALLHGPEALPADAPLSDEELRELADRLPPAARRLLLKGPATEDLTEGDVAVAFSRGMTQALRVGEVFFAVPREWQGDLQWERHRVGPIALATVRMVPEEGHALAVLVATNGTSYVVVGAGTGEHTMSGGHAGGLPGPLIAWRKGRPWRLALRLIEDRLTSGEIARALPIDDLVMSVNDYMSGTVVEGPVPWLALGWAPTVNGDLKVGAGKVGPALEPGDWTVGVEAEGEAIVIRSSVNVPPALAQFYGMPQFEVRVHPDAGMTITTEAGETLELPAPQ